MHLSPFTQMTDRDAIEQLVKEVAVAQIVTTLHDEGGPTGVPTATLAPILWEGDRIVAHVARANPQFRHLPEHTPVLAIVTGPDAYVTPRWLPSKEKHGFAVPTWNYLAVHFTGTLTLHTDPAWLWEAVGSLSHRHEDPRPQPWTMAEAPHDYLNGILRAVLGLEIAITGIEAKAKLSGNRTEPDRLGIIAGLREEPDPSARQVAHEMERREPRPLGPGADPLPGR